LSAAVFVGAPVSCPEKIELREVSNGERLRERGLSEVGGTSILTNPAGEPVDMSSAGRLMIETAMRSGINNAWRKKCLRIFSTPVFICLFSIKLVLLN